MEQYRLEGDTFIISDYEKAPAFSSFLPGLAGVKGIPVWTFYTNRGQAINSLGIHHKGNAIMEFNPANTAYENTALKGFRTFIRKNGSFYEPFSVQEEGGKRSLQIKKNSVSITERNERTGLTVHVNYFVLPTENVGALVRRVTVTNEGDTAAELELLDGLPKIIPYGIQNGAFKEMSNLLKSWTEIKNLENGVPYYTMRASSDDSAEVAEIEGGYFYCTEKDGELLPVVYDAETVFSYETSLAVPVIFKEEGLSGVLEKTPCFANKVPCGFTPLEAVLAPKESLTFTSYIGFAGSILLLNAKKEEFLQRGYADAKEAEADALVDLFMQDVRTRTGSPLFDQYVEQCYLDNFLRGGYPYTFAGGEKPAVVHLFSRKHGDPERDYNFFSIAGEYYSQGNGNYRDVCQNRRSDVFFHPEIGDFNIYNFFSLVQIDGYNPLEIRPSTFRIREERKAETEKLLQKAFPEEEALKAFAFVLQKGFTPGQIANTIAGKQLKPKMDEEELLRTLIKNSEECIEAGFGEGYWSDHFDYNMDLVENYLMVFPDKKEELFFGRSDYRFYDSAARLRDRSETYVLNKSGRVRQYGSLVHDEEKENREGFVKNGTNWLKNADGSYVQTTLFGKMMTLAATKITLLDPFGMGIEMEGGKPGWNDAMNGLPGLFGSGMPETCELKRLLVCMREALEESFAPDSIVLPAEVAKLFLSAAFILQTSKEEGSKSFVCWNALAELREGYRKSVRWGLTGETKALSKEEVLNGLNVFLEKIEDGYAKAEQYGNGIMPTYFTYEATDYTVRTDENGETLISPYGLPSVAVTAFDIKLLPPFLEGPARSLATMEKERARTMCAKIKASDLYDEKLKMYKTSGSLEAISMENGRIRAFTPGWLERESIFLHMEYKYFLAMLKAGLYEEYEEAIKDALIPFLPPKRYGRSILENSSFLASSANPDEKVHGRGYVARLSGSTTEMLSMWITMFLGVSGGFGIKDGELSLRFAPALPAWLFDENGEASFTLLSKCKVTYHNASGRATYGADKVAVKEIRYTENGTDVAVTGDMLTGDAAEKVRSGKITELTVELA